MVENNQNIEPKKKSKKDENILYIEELSNKKFEFVSKLIFSTFDNKGTSSKSSSNNQENILDGSWKILEDEIMLMKNEFDNLIKVFKTFYTSDVYKLADWLGEKVTPMKVNRVINYFITRIKRMVYVLEPEFSIINFFDKKSKYHYQMIKGYWINDDGKRVRSLSRNIANAEATINDLIMKFFKMNRNDVIIYEPETGDDGESNIVIAVGRKEYTLKTTNMKKEDFIRVYTMFELWKLYKKEYKLLNLKQ